MTLPRVAGLLPSFPELDRSIGPSVKESTKTGAFCPVDLIRGPHAEFDTGFDVDVVEVSEGKEDSELVSNEAEF